MSRLVGILVAIAVLVGVNALANAGMVAALANGLGEVSFIIPIVGLVAGVLLAIRGYSGVAS